MIHKLSVCIDNFVYEHATWVSSSMPPDYVHAFIPFSLFRIFFVSDFEFRHFPRNVDLTQLAFTCSKLTIETVKHISHLVLVFLSLTFNM